MSDLTNTTSISETDRRTPWPGFVRRVINIGLIILISCGSTRQEEDHSYYVESKLSFYDPYDNSFTVDKWIRKPENIRIAHESFKKYGYGNIFSENDLHESPCWIPGLDEGVRNKTCKDIIDSLLIHYSTATTAPKYYREFWARRRNEANDSIVFAVLTELKAEFFGNKIDFQQQYVNDTIVTLLKIQKGPVTNATAIRHFEYLKSIGLHRSAHNLLYERYSYYDVNWDKDRLDEGLRKDTIKCCPSAVFEDDTK